MDIEILFITDLAMGAVPGNAFADIHRGDLRTCSAERL
jgi:hypothetical protein